MPGTLMPAPRFTGWDDVGDPIPGGLLYTFASGTTTPQPTYTDAALSVPNTNPIVLDAAGRAVVFLAPGILYTITLRTATGVQVWSQPDVGGAGSAGGSSTGDGDVLGTAGETLPFGAVVALSNGTDKPGGVPTVAGRWYLANAEPDNESLPSTLQAWNTTPEIGMTPALVGNGLTGTVRTSGTMTGLIGLVAGTLYYVGANGGLTAVPPTLWPPRVVGIALSTTSLLLMANPPPVTTVLPIVQRLSSADPDLDLTPGVTLLMIGHDSGPAVTVFDLSALAPGTHGQEFLIVPHEAGTQVILHHEDTGFAAARRLTLRVTSAPTLLMTGGWARLRYDALVQRWALIAHDQGPWFDVLAAAIAGGAPALGALSAAFTGLAPMTWLVATADVIIARYRLVGTFLHLRLNLVLTSFSGTGSLSVKIGKVAYGNFTTKLDSTIPNCAMVTESGGGGVLKPCYIVTSPGGALLTLSKLEAVAFVCPSSNATDFYIDVQVEVT